MSTQTATVETLTAEVRVLMVGSRQVTLSVYRQLDRHPSDQVRPFGRVSDKQDESRYGCRNVFVVGCDVTTGVLVRSEHFVVDPKPQRYKELIDRRDIKSGRSYTNQRNSVQPFSAERRKEERRQVHSRRVQHGSGVWVWAESMDEYKERVSAWEEAVSKYKEWTSLPLIVLAGLR